MIKFVKAILGLGAKKTKGQFRKSRTRKAQIRVAIKRDYIEEAVSETAFAARAEQASAKTRYRHLDERTFDRIMREAINSSQHIARTKARNAATQAWNQGKGRIYILRVGKKCAQETYRNAIDYAINEYKADFEARQVEVQRQALIKANDEAILEAQRKIRLPRAGHDIEQDISIGLSEAYTGVQRNIRIDSRDIKFRVPRGAATGTKVQVQGLGQPGIHGGPNGQLVLTVNICEDEHIERVGDDLYCKRNIVAEHGDIVHVPNLLRPIHARIPEGTQSGQMLRLIGFGMPKLGADGEFGDLHFKVTIALDPELEYIIREGYEALREEEKQLEERLEELRRTTGATEPRESKVKKNADFHHYQEQQALVLMQLEKIQWILHNSVVLEYGGTGDEVILSSTVILREVGGNEHEEFKIVGHHAASSRERKISIKSPIGKALMGEKAGSKVKVNAPDGELQFEIIDVR